MKHQAPVYKSLNNFLPVIGVPFGYMGFLCGLAVAIYMVSHMSFLWPSLVLVTGHMVGIVLTIKDNRWWEVVTVSCRYFRFRWIGRVCYVC